MTITTWEMFGGGVIITLYFLFNNTLYYLFNNKVNMVTIYNKLNIRMITEGIDIIYIMILGLICTAFAFYASIEIMKKITPFTVKGLFSFNVASANWLSTRNGLYSDNSKIYISL